MPANELLKFIRECTAMCALHLLLTACGGDARDVASRDEDRDAGSRTGRKPSAGSASNAGSENTNDAGPSSTSNPNPTTTAGTGAPAQPPDDAFSFFVTSFAAMQRLSGSQDGFGGDLRYGEADGLAGADKICREIAEGSQPGAGKKTWRAFLSATRGPDGQPIHAIDRIGKGPWYDRRGRLVAPTLADLMSTRPQNGDPTIADDLPNEDGVPNHAPEGEPVDNHDVLTGSDALGRLYKNDWGVTCHDWTSSVGADGRPRVGHSWPRGFGDFSGFGSLFGDGGFPGFGDGGFPGFPGFGGGDGGAPFDFASFDGENWASALDEAGCAAGASLVEMGPPNPNNPTVGSGGGYGAIYCFSTTP
jgi:hypothetical protein